MDLAACIEMLYTELTFEERFEAAKKDGFQAVEFWDWRDKDLFNIKNICDNIGIKVSNFSGNRETSMIDPEMEDPFLIEVENAVHAAKKIDCSTLMLLVQPLLPNDAALLPAGKLSDKEKQDQIIRVGKKVGKIAQDYDMEFVIEPLNTVLDHPDYFLNRSQLSFDIMRAIDNPRVKVLYDVYHMAMEDQDVFTDLEKNMDIIGYVHIADKPGRNEPGSGTLDYQRVFTLLIQLGYNGTLGFEFNPSGIDSRSVLKTVFEKYPNLVQG